MGPNRVFIGRELGIHTRDERNDDADKIRRVTEMAFQTVPYTEHREQFIVRALRQANALAVSQVAETDGELLGHVAISPVQISDSAVNWFGLGPYFQARSFGGDFPQGEVTYHEAFGVKG